MPQKSLPSDPLGTAKDGLVFREPEITDGSAVHALIRACPPLDVNSVYNYLLLCAHHARTCVVVEKDGEVAAYVSGYIKPDDPEVFFVWQVAVGEAARGRGVGKRMLHHLVERPHCQGIRYMETTITPDNQASWALFRSFARDRDAKCEDRVLFSSEHFGADGHEPEHVLRIGPF